MKIIVMFFFLASATLTQAATLSCDASLLPGGGDSQSISTFGILKISITGINFYASWDGIGTITSLKIKDEQTGAFAKSHGSVRQNDGSVSNSNYAELSLGIPSGLTSFRCIVAP